MWNKIKMCELSGYCLNNERDAILLEYNVYEQDILINDFFNNPNKYDELYFGLDNEIIVVVINNTIWIHCKEESDYNEMCMILKKYIIGKNYKFKRNYYNSDYT